MQYKESPYNIIVYDGCIYVNIEIVTSLYVNIEKNKMYVNIDSLTDKLYH